MTKVPLVVLAAGKGTRLQPLTATVAKPLLKLLGKPVLSHTLEGALDYASEIIIVTGQHAEQFETCYQDQFHDIPVKYVHQEEQKGTGDALMHVRDHITSEWFMCIYGDDFYGAEVFQMLGSCEGNGVVGKQMDQWQRFGVLKKNEDGSLAAIIEKPTEFVSDIVNTGAYRFHRTIFEEGESLKPSVRGELELIDLISALREKEPVQVTQTTTEWLPIAYPWDLLTLAEAMLNKMESDIQGTVEVGAIIKGKVQLGKGSVIMAGAYISGNVYIGENCSIGPNCYIRNFASIGDDCNVGASVEIKGSILGDRTKAPHLAYIPDSVLGNDVNYAAGTITADLRHDNGNVKSMVNGELIDTGRRKFGTVMGDGARTGIHTTIYPGRKIWNGKSTVPGQIVDNDIQ